MLPAEARWLERTLTTLRVDELSPLLSVGSGTWEVRTRHQPWIDQRVFRPLAARGVEVLHHELEPGPGVDVSGDLQDPLVLADLHRRGVRSVLCANVLEHVPARRQLAAALAGAVPPGGHLVVTVPHRFPYHPDPVDTGYRPSARELVAEFPALVPLVAEDLECGTLIRYLASVPTPVQSIRRGFRSMVTRPRERASSPSDDVARREAGGAATILFRPAVMACALLTRPSVRTSLTASD